ncbi:MAG: hypothetical protein WCP79_05830 [Bacillota bacterium]
MNGFSFPTAHYARQLLVLDELRDKQRAMFEGGAQCDGLECLLSLAFAAQESVEQVCLEYGA